MKKLPRTSLSKDDDGTPDWEDEPSILSVKGRRSGVKSFFNDGLQPPIQNPSLPLSSLQEVPSQTNFPAFKTTRLIAHGRVWEGAYTRALY